MSIIVYKKQKDPSCVRRRYRSEGGGTPPSPNTWRISWVFDCSMPSCSC